MDLLTFTRAEWMSLAAIVAGVVVWLVVGVLGPVWFARARQHPQVRGIELAAVVALFLPPVALVAWGWALYKPHEAAPRLWEMAGVEVTDAAATHEGAGIWAVSGIDTATGEEATRQIRASDLRHAIAAAEVGGLAVVRVDLP